MYYYNIQKKLIDLDLINKFSFCKSINIPKLSHIVLNINLNKNEFDSDLLNVKLMLALEILCTQKPFVKNKKQKKSSIKDKNLFFNLQSILRGKNMYDFIYFFQIFIYKYLKEKFVFINKNIEKCDYFFSIKDLSVFPGLSENLIYSKIYLHFLLSTKNVKRKEELYIILRNYCFIL